VYQIFCQLSEHSLHFIVSVFDISYNNANLSYVHVATWIPQHGFFNTNGSGHPESGQAPLERRKPQLAHDYLHFFGPFRRCLWSYQGNPMLRSDSVVGLYPMAYQVRFIGRFCCSCLMTGIRIISDAISILILQRVWNHCRRSSPVVTQII
jgi:hypothetical protein